jgi:hypothetical protein
LALSIMIGAGFPHMLRKAGAESSFPGLIWRGGAGARTL